MFNGYAQFGGTEIVNVARTRAYIEKNNASFPFNACEVSDGLQEALGDDAYESPIQDDAPWYDPQNPASARFYGLYPLSMEGFEDDTRTGTTNENIGDGGFTSGLRHGTRSLRVHGVLLGADEDAVSAGLAWLKGAVASGGCDDGDCTGSSMCWYSARPNIVECYDADAGTMAGTEVTGWLNSVTPTSFFAPAFDGRFSVAWDIPQTDGVVFRYGMTTKEGVPLNNFGPYVSARTNLLLDPSFNVGTAGWVKLGTTGMAVQPTGGVDGGSYVALTSSTHPRIDVFNYIPQSSAEVPPTTWTTNGVGGVEVVPAIDAPLGTEVIRIQQDFNLDTLWLEVPIVGPATPVAGTVSFYMDDTPDAVSVTVYDETRTSVATALFPAGFFNNSGFSRASIASMIGANYTIHIETNGVRATAPLLIDGFMATPGALIDYFDGNTEDDPNTKSIYRWVTNDETQGSFWGTYNTESPLIGVTGPNPIKAGFGPVTVSFDMRSDAFANVTLTIYTSTNAVMTTQTWNNVSSNWTRVYVTADQGNSFYFKIEGDSEFDIDQIMVEHGDAWLPYFDTVTPTMPFDLADPEDYTFSTTVAGLARMVWNGKPDANNVAHSIVFPDVCGNDWVANLIVDFGQFPSSTVKWSAIGRVDGPTQAERWERTFHEVIAISGPSVLTDYPLHSGGAAKEIEMIFTAGPYAYGATTDIVVYTPVTSLTNIPWYDIGWLTDHNDFIDPIVNNIANFTTSVSGGTATITKDTAPGTSGLPTNFHGNAAKATCTGAGAYIDLRNVRTILAVTAGETRSFSVYAKENAAVAGATINTFVQFFNSAGTQVGSTSTVTQATALSTTAYTRYKHENVVVPATAVTAALIIRENGTIPSGHILWATAFMSNPGTVVGRTTSGNFIDPAGLTLYSFDGTQFASPSSRYATFQCAVDPSIAPIVDPTQPVAPAKPVAPIIVNPGLSVPTKWTRYYIAVDADEVSAWNQTIPTITITSKSALVRSVRVRFYPNPFGYTPDAVDPCSYCSEFILSYIPANTELTIDGTVQQATASVAGAVSQPASNLLYGGANGNPMTWPSLSCGVAYVVTIDTPTTAPSDLTVSLSMTRQE